MSYTPAELIAYNLSQLRRHMTAQGCTEAQWRAALEKAATPRWQPIETAPQNQDVLVCVTHNTGADECETIYWIDFATGQNEWALYPELIWVPFPPTHWMHITAKPQPADMTRPGDKVFDL